MLLLFGLLEILVVLILQPVCVRRPDRGVGRLRTSGCHGKVCESWPTRVCWWLFLNHRSLRHRTPELKVSAIYIDANFGFEVLFWIFLLNCIFFMIRHILIFQADFQNTLFSRHLLKEWILRCVWVLSDPRLCLSGSTCTHSNFEPWRFLVFGLCGSYQVMKDCNLDVFDSRLLSNWAFFCFK